MSIFPVPEPKSLSLTGHHRNNILYAVHPRTGINIQFDLNPIWPGQTIYDLSLSHVLASLDEVSVTVSGLSEGLEDWLTWAGTCENVSTFLLILSKLMPISCFWKKRSLNMNRYRKKWTGAVRFLDPKIIVWDTKIIILCASVQELCPKTHFHEMAENIMYP